MRGCKADVGSGAGRGVILWCSNEESANSVGEMSLSLDMYDRLAAAENTPLQQEALNSTCRTCKLVDVI